MTIVNTKTNQVNEGLRPTKAGRLIGVHRNTIQGWQKKRRADKTFKEVYNHFIIYFTDVRKPLK